MTEQKKGDEVAWTINAIQSAMRADGSHWWDPDTMRGFGTRVASPVYQGPGGVFFVTEDDQCRRELPKVYTVRQFDPETLDINTNERDYHTLVAARLAARKAARKAARGGAKLAEVQQNTEKHQPVSILEQFVADLRKHGKPDASVVTARTLIRHSFRHHYYCECQCNGGPEAEFAERNMSALVRNIKKAAQDVGAKGVVFQGDPRGCTVKLVFHDGATNDFGGDGWCVPTDEKE